uniref:Putative argonaute n=1 Tax=Cupiennius salei TaxID=6928 RepID=A0A061QLI6_CUPSA
MPKKGKGRGRGRGTPSESTAPVPRGERRPGFEEDRNRGHGRERGRAQLAPQEAQQHAEMGASRGRDTTTLTSGAMPPKSVRKPDVQQTSVPEFFAKEATSVTQPGASGPVTESDRKFKSSSQEAHSMKEEGLAFVREETEMSSKASSRKKKLHKAEEEAVLSKTAGISLGYKEPVKQTMAKRPNYAIIDERNHIPLYVNYFKLTFKDTVVYHYDIDISDSTKDKKIGKSVMSEGRTLKEDIEHNVKHVEHQKRRNMGKAKCREIISKMFCTNETLKKYCPVYDGQKNLFTSQSLPCKNSTQFPVDITLEGKDKRFFVTLTPVKKKDQTNIISLEPLKELYTNRSNEIPSEVLLVFETVMSHREPPLQQVHFRNSFFYLQGGMKTNLGYGLEIWRGYDQSVQLTKSGPVVVINLAAKAFHKAGPVIDYACDVLRTDITNIPRLTKFQIRSLSEALKGLQIQVTHQRHPRKYKIKAVSDDAASEILLEVNKKKVSVAQYFLEKYRRLNYPHLPCLHMHSNNNTTFIPMETCEVTEGQPKIGKLSAELTSTMIRSTAVDPKTRKDAIVKTASEVNNISGKYMKAFGLLMDIKMIQVDGRIIAAPQIAYGGPPDDMNRIAKPDKKGVWRVEGGKNFYKVVKIENWVLISFADRRRFGYEILNKFCQFLVESGRKCGMRLDRPKSVEIYGREISTEKVLYQAKKSGAEMAVVVLNRRDEYHTYDEVKFLADFKYNLVTQCMEDKTLGRINDQITTNVCLKVNVKLGGINHILHQKLKVFNEPVTVLGIDAIHWVRGCGYPSIVSIVGSLNPTASRYALTCDLQRNKKGRISQEIITDMKKMSKVILNKFKEENRGRDPVKIIVFRDGVSDGQFQHALDYEVGGLQEACNELFQKILPITYLIVQKHHQTRLFPARPNQGVGKNLNVPPGTCVDKDITHPVYFDYYICSHEGIQGTSKPAHYTILHDDNHFSSDELQQLCHFLCHTNVRCTRSVSLPAPVMYADLAAARAKKYADLHIASDNASSDSNIQRNLPDDVEKAIRGMQSFENNMFYI